MFVCDSKPTRVSERERERERKRNWFGEHLAGGQPLGELEIGTGK